MTIHLANYSELGKLSDSLFEPIEDFYVHLQDTQDFNMGVHLSFCRQSSPQEPLLSFPWWDHADAHIRNWQVSQIPLGDLNNPYDDGEQGWQILIWENQGFVYCLVGDDIGTTEFECAFRIARDKYFSAWSTAISQAKNEFFNFLSLTEALNSAGQARGLLLWGQNLQTVPDAISRLRNLEVLNLGLNQLQTLPENLFELKNLRCLNLSHNQFKVLPEVIRQLSKLEELNLQENPINQLPSWLNSMPLLKRVLVTSKG